MSGTTELPPLPATMSQGVTEYRDAMGPPRSAYIHVPFCRHRCGYCNFAIVSGRDYLMDSFLDALQIQIAKLPSRFELDTLFLGGGTPSHLTSSHLARLTEILESRFDFDSDAEVTAECNPSDISVATLNSLACLGVNRISLGVQSFHEEKLKVLQRDHSREIAKQAFDLSMQRFGNVSLDLIFAAPGETMGQWERDLETALSLQPSHLSTYELTWEKGTQFWSRRLKGELRPAHEDLGADMYQHTIDRCESAGLSQYEVSSFARRATRCRHNQQYWFCNPWFAFGPGAASFVDCVRNTNHASTTRWIRQSLAGESTISLSEPLTAREHAMERLIFGLRMVDGIPVQAFEIACDCKISELAGDEIVSLTEQELIEFREGNLRLTDRGRMLADTVSVTLLN